MKLENNLDLVFYSPFSTMNRMNYFGGINDKSDAFRHYVWAGLLTNSLGPIKAKQYLDAHEQNPLQPREERSMDLANNRAGSLAAERLIEKKQFSIEKQEEAALKA